MKKLLSIIAIATSFALCAMENEKENEEYQEGVISFFEAYLSARFPKEYLSDAGVKCDHYKKGSKYTFDLKFKDVPGHLENARKKVADLYDDKKRTLPAIENLLKKGHSLNLDGQFSLAVQALHQFHTNADLDGSHEEIKGNRQIYKNAWMSKDNVEIIFALRLPLYPKGETHIPLLQRIEQLKQELKNQAVQS